MWVARRFGLDELLVSSAATSTGSRLAILLTRFLRFGIQGAPRGERLRLALESLGPIFVKFGQVLSTRRDLLPPDIADELAKLQDRVPPFRRRASPSRRSSARFGRPLDERLRQLRRARRWPAPRSRRCTSRVLHGRPRGRRQGAAAGHAGGRSTMTSR